MPQKFSPSGQNETVEQAVRVLTFIEKTAGLLRAKVEKEKKVPTWLITRLNQIVVELKLTAPFLASASDKKKFEPSKGD